MESQSWSSTLEVKYLDKSLVTVTSSQNVLARIAWSHSSLCIVKCVEEIQI